MLNMKVTQLSHLGAREEQQDSIYSDSRPDGYILLVVADGAGGHIGGKNASRKSTLFFTQTFQKVNLAEPTQYLSESILAIHKSIVESGHSNNRGRTTIVASIVCPHLGKVWSAHSGDSRFYHFRNGELFFRSRDHSIVQALVDREKITEEEMGTHPDQGRLTQSLGSEEYSEPEYYESQWTSNDRVLLCSDGYWEHLSLQEMEKAASFPLEKASILLKKYIKLSVTRAGDKADNTSVVYWGEKDVNKSKLQFKKFIVLVAGSILAIILAIVGGYQLGFISDKKNNDIITKALTTFEGLNNSEPEGLVNGLDHNLEIDDNVIKPERKPIVVTPNTGYPTYDQQQLSSKVIVVEDRKMEVKDAPKIIIPPQEFNEHPQRAIILEEEDPEAQSFQFRKLPALTTTVDINDDLVDSIIRKYTLPE